MADIRTDYFHGNTTVMELFDLMVGDKLGHGQDRTVYLCGINPDLVVKFEHTVGRFQNVNEWGNWERSEGSDLRKWLAPCRYISPCGAVLVQDRTAPLRRREVSGRKIVVPDCLNDIKMDNWGKLGGKMVCHDYGMMRFHFNKIVHKKTIDFGV